MPVLDKRVYKKKIGCTKKIGRPQTVTRNKKEQKEYLKIRSRLYYSNEQNKIRQKERMKIYFQENKAKINTRRRRLKVIRIVKPKLQIFINKHLQLVN